jgi:eukaryotic-like serine/threonine-protein kinase
MTGTVVLPQSPLAGLKRGDVVAGKYRLEHELGRGAMGTVWAAAHTTLGQKVAIKLIADEQLTSTEARRRFSLEAKAAARLKSRHAVQVYDDGETPEGVPYIVMEYLEGETLEARLERQKDLGLPEAIRITTHIGRALAKAHARGIVHRDLKSGNVFIAKTDDDELGWIAKVLDFGVAKLSDMTGAATTKTGTLVGTPLFMSPEQIRGASHVDHRADLYSVGMVFYNMVTGHHAFNGPSYSDVLVAICTEPLPKIQERAPWLPETVGAWFEKACARELVDRFQSADEMIEALREAAGPHSRLSRASVPEGVSGPSGTIVGHAPPHVMNTVAVAAVNLDLDQPASDDTLRSRTGPLASPEPRRDSQDVVVTERGRRSGLGYAVFALSGVGLALALVLGALVVRYAYRILGSDDRATTMSPTVVLPAAPAPSDPVALPTAPSTPSPPTPPSDERATPAASAATRTPLADAPSGGPRRVPASDRPAHARATAPSATPGAPKALEPAAPDMGF